MSRSVNAGIKVAIIGGGWSGIECASGLARRGYSVSVYEASPHWGGRARSAELRLAGQQLTLDNGQHLLLGAYQSTLAAISRVHHGPASIRRSRLRLQGPDGFDLSRWPLPGQLGLAFGLAFARGLSVPSKLAAVRIIMALRRARWTANNGIDTVAQLLTAYRQPPELIRLFWEPLCVGALNTDPEQACARSFLAVLRDSIGAGPNFSDFLICTCPLGELFPIPAANALRGAGHLMLTGARIDSLSRDAQAWRIHSRQHPQLAQQRFDHLVIATSHLAAARLMAPIDEPAATQLQSLGSASIATVYLAWKAAVDIPRVALLAENRTLNRPGQWLFDRGTIKGLRIAAVVVSARERLQDLTNEALAQAVGQQLEHELALPGADDIRVISERNATWRCTPARPQIDEGFLARRLGQDGHGLWLAGDYLDPEYPATIEAAIRSGDRAAMGIGGAAGNRSA